MANRKSKLMKIKTAIISVSDKTNLNVLLPILKKFKIRILSSGGTYRYIKKLKYKCTEISNYTSFPEMLDGRVKTLHPKIYAGILNVRQNFKHKKDIKKENIENIDLVIVDLYPFEKKFNDKLGFRKLIEYIDIGGPSLIRAAAKNFNDVTVISDLNNYGKLIAELKKQKGSTSYNFRKLMATEAFSLTAYYDSLISGWLNKESEINFPRNKIIHGKILKNLRYGENPHQKASIYSTTGDSNLEQLHGKELSFNNYSDIYSALNILSSFKNNTGVAIIKHSNPCGVSAEKSQIVSFDRALICDPISAYGGIVGINSIISNSLAKKINKKFFEIVVARGFTKNALKILKGKKNLRLIKCGNFNFINSQHYLFLGNAFLVQDSDNLLIQKKMKIVTKRKPSLEQIKNLKFAFNICKFAKSNAIVLANKNSTIGIGSGQPSRLDSCRIATEKAREFVPDKIAGAVAASDAFFPFADGINHLIESGVEAIIQPGGSVNDKKVIDAANEAGIVMVFTGTRHFKH